MKLNKKKSLHDLLMESYKPHLVDFAEASVFSFGEFRKKKYDAVWTVKSIGKIQGHRVNGEMKIDYGIFFDPSDAYIQEVMTYFFPEFIGELSGMADTFIKQPDVFRSFEHSNLKFITEDE